METMRKFGSKKMRLKYAATAALLGLALAGCQRTTYNDNNTGPAPLQAQPVPRVQSSQLPPATSYPSASASQYPAPPAAGTPPAQAGQNVQVASNAMDVTKDAMVGSWKVNSAGKNCDMFLTLTNLGNGSRGGTRGCVGELTTMGSWEVSGKQILLRNRDGGTIGTLYKTADAQFSGSTSSGQPISLSR